MAPRRRKGGNRRNAQEQFSVGDLVLAKVRGYPAWPAKISRPEDWECSPDPKKCFVQFFGTFEIAFVAPADIQVFTIESKNELHARAQRKHSKVFARAVEEICEAFGGLHPWTSDQFVKDVYEAASTVKDDKLNETYKLEDLEEMDTQKEKAKDECTHVELPGLKPRLPDSEGTFPANAQLGGSYRHKDDKLNETYKLEDLEEMDTQKEKAKDECTHVELPGLKPCFPDSEGTFPANAQLGGSYRHKGTEASVSSKCGKPLNDCTEVLREERAPISMSPSKFSALRGEQSPSLFHEVREEDCMKICLESKELVHDSKVFTMDEPHVHFDGRKIKDDADDVKDEGFPLVGSSFNFLSDLHMKRENGCNALDSVTEPIMNIERGLKLPKRYTAKNQLKHKSTGRHPGQNKSQDQLADKLGKEAVSSLDSGGENSPVSVSNLSKVKETKYSMELQKHSYSRGSLFPGYKMRLDATKGQHTGSSASLGDQRENTAKSSQDKRKMDIPEKTQPQAKIMKKQGHAVDIDAETNVSGKGNSSYYVARRKANKPLKKGKSSPSLTSNNFLPLTAEQMGERVHLSGDEAQPLSGRRHIQAVDVSLKPTKSVKDVKSLVLLKNDIPVSDYRKSPVHSSIRRRAFWIDDDEIDEMVHRTPVHRMAEDMCMDGVSNVSATRANSQDHLESPIYCQPNTRETTTDSTAFAKLDEKPYRDRKLTANLETNSLHQCPRLTEENRAEKILEKHVSVNPRKLVYSSSSLREQKATSESPKASTGPGAAGKLVQHKTIKPDKSSATASVRIKAVSSKNLSGNSGCLRPYNQVTRQVMKPISLEKLLGTQRNNLQMNEVTENRSDVNFSAERNIDDDILAAKRFDMMNAQAGNSMEKLKLTDSITSMKHLIAVARAKRRQAYSHDNDITGAVSTTSVTPQRSPSPFATEHMSTPMMFQKDSKGSYPHFVFPSNIAENYSSMSKVGCEEHEHLIIPGGQPPGGSLSGSTEAAIAHDAFKGMIETLSRTKESIGRATRLAIDCAKYGMASQVVDLLVRKLESEPGFHRRVDLFFLVDSITQCSHSQKGIAESSYIPTVQAALSRLLSAAAPPGGGAGTNENRRQCHKVLRLWLERKIFPESFLRPFLDGIEVRNNAMSSSNFHRRSLRVERSIDDPIREIEGMVVDEYGSNVSFQLSGLLSMHIFEETADFRQTSCEDANNGSTVEAGDAPGELDACMITPTSGGHCVSEHVNGELEMEDVSASSKIGIAAVRYSFNLEHDVSILDKILESKSDTPTECPTLSDVSPHLPLGSPPPPPPLPPSPPPPLPLSSTSPPPSFLSASAILPPPMSHASPPSAYHSSAHQNYCKSPSGRNTSSMTETTVRQTHDFPVAGVSNSRLLAASFNPQFQPTGASFSQGSSHALPAGQIPASFPFAASLVSFHHPPAASQTPLHFPYTKPVVQYHSQQQYYPYSFFPQPNGEKQHVADEHWRIHSRHENSVKWHGPWATECTAEASSWTHVQDGFLRSNVDRLSHGFQFPSLASVPSVSVPPAYSVPGMAGYPHS